jgi:[protein-PII] uridylyltransferase
MGVFTAEEYEVFAEAAVPLEHAGASAPADRAGDRAADLRHPGRARRDHGLHSTAGQRAVERFMQRYFTDAKNVGDLTRIFLTALEAQHVEEAGTRSGSALRNVFAFGKDRTGAGFG